MKIKLVLNSEVEVTCPECKVKLVVKENSRNEHQFLGCKNYPKCDHTQEIPEFVKMQAVGHPTLF